MSIPDSLPIPHETSVAPEPQTARRPGEKWAHGDPDLVREARTSVFHHAFAVGAWFAVGAIVIALLLPMMRTSEHDGVPGA
jgi:hypothetical protein